MLLPYFHKKILEAGCDEVGRGCLAGPVFAAAVILPKNFSHQWINDSKKLTKLKREEVYNIILENAIAYSIQSVSVEEIDTINILKASHKAMHLAIDGIISISPPEHLLIDGNSFPAYISIPHTCIIKGDGKYLSIAAASILAKVERDRYMEELHEAFPHYNWKKNKGYGTKEHLTAIQKYGNTPHHRTSFKPKFHSIETNK